MSSPDEPYDVELDLTDDDHLAEPTAKVFEADDLDPPPVAGPDRDDRLGHRPPRPARAVSVVERVLDVARSQLGTRESPPGSNRQRYGAAYGANGVAWCQIFCWWVFRTAGADGLVPKGAYTPTVSGWFRDRDQWGNTPRPGALGYFDFPSPPHRISHVGIVEAVNLDGSIVTIEGNTSPGGRGSQRDGGGVWRRTRRAYIAGYGYPAYPTEPAPPRPPAAGGSGRPVLRRGWIGPEVAQLQTVLARWYPWLQLQVDGKFGPATEAAVRELQRRAGIAADGVVGPDTYAALHL